MSKTFLFQAIQLSQKVLIQTIQFSISLLSGATISSQSGPGSNGNESVLRFPKAPAILEPHHQIV